MGTTENSGWRKALIPSDRLDVFESGRSILETFGAQTNVRGRFVALYLGLRRMGNQVAPLGSEGSTPTAAIEHFLDGMFTKSHRDGPVVVLTAPFGGSTSGGYSASTGVTAPGNKYPTNTWRNNFGIQKGVGCPASPETITHLLADPGVRLACPHMAVDPDDRYTCSIANTAYRGDEHSVWLRISDDGYQVVDLDDVSAYGQYLSPSGRQIPIFPLIAVLYGFAPAGVYPERDVVGIPDFAQDFRFSLEQVEALFDCEPESAMNAQLLSVAQGLMTPAAPAPGVAAPGAVEVPMPVLGPVTALNTGVGAEILVADALVDQGWSVVYRGNQRGFGYDVEATRDGETLHIEVKSSVGFTTPELTESEWQAAQLHGDTFVLAVVDFYGSEEQRIWYLRNPAANAVPAELATTTYRLARTDIHPLSTEVEFL